MTSKKIIKSVYLTALFVVTLIFPTLCFAQAELPSIEITQQENTLDIEIKIVHGTYLSDETLDVSIEGESVLLESIFYQDSEVFDDRDVFFDNAKIKAIVKGEADSSFSVILDYQVCTKKHECSDVLTFERSFKTSNGSKAKQTTNKIEETKEPIEALEPIMEQDSIANMLKDKSLILTLTTFFGFGLLLAFTPCMLPVIPILSAVILSKQENMTAKRGFLLSLAYVLSMSLVYAIAGVIAASLGSNVQAFFQQTWIIILFSSFFFILSLAMFGTFNIEMPQRLQTFLTNKSASSERTTYVGVIFLGILSALIVGPCVAPPLAGALIYISQTGNELIGGLSLFVMSFGMGIPLLLLGAGAGKFIPKPGPWMESVKLIFGFVMLGFSVWVLSRIIAPELVLFLWGLLLVAAAVFMNIFEARNLVESHTEYQLKKLFSILCLIFGVILIVGSISGAKNIKSPLEPFIAKTTNVVVKKNSFEVISASELASAVSESSNQLMFMFTADWCDNCKALERDVFSKSDVMQELGVFDLYKIDITGNTDEDIAMLKRFGLFGPPGIIFFDKEKNELSRNRLVGYKDKEQFLEHINKVKKLVQ